MNKFLKQSETHEKNRGNNRMLGTNVSYERIGKKSTQACDITLACASVARKKLSI